MARLWQAAPARAPIEQGDSILASDQRRTAPEAFGSTAGAVSFSALRAHVGAAPLACLVRCPF
jgi:hypothetical protein